MLKFKKIICLIVLFSCFISMNVVYASDMNYKQEVHLDFECKEEIFYKVIDLYKKIKENFKWNGKSNYIVMTENLINISLENLIDWLHSEEQKPVETELSDIEIMSYFWNFIFEWEKELNPRRICDAEIILFSMHDFNVMRTDGRIIPEYHHVGLMFKLKGEWVILDPILALEAETIEEGVNYLAISLEEYKTMIKENLGNPSICVNYTSMFYNVVINMPFEELNNDAIIERWHNIKCGYRMQNFCD